MAAIGDYRLIMLLQEYYKNLNGGLREGSFCRGLICYTANEAWFCLWVQIMKADGA
jgi:hypothetical protein